MLDENDIQVLEWWKRLNKKIKDKPEPVKVLQRRTMNSALAILQNLQGIPFEKLSMSLYFYCQDLKMYEFTHQYEAQVELAGANPEKFVFQLHNFYNALAAKIKKEDLYSEFFEFYSKCVRLRFENENQHIEDKVLLAYLNLLTQHTEYMKPSKFDFNVCIAGRRTTGEILTAVDPFPNIDSISYELEEGYENGTITSDPEGAIVALCKKHSFPVNSMFEWEMLVGTDKIQSTTTAVLLPFINEFTFDILPKTPFSIRTDRIKNLKSSLDLTTIHQALTKRKQTLPSNGVRIDFSDNSIFKTLFLKEILYDNSIYFLYRLVTTQDGDLSGYYDTREPFLYTSLRDYHENPTIAENIEKFLLFCYGCYTLRDDNFNLLKINDFFIIQGELPLAAQGYMQGGKLKNVIDEEKSTGTARKGNDAYETEDRAVQGYIRKLPKNQQASQQAIEYAQSLGYDLESDETYVRPFITAVFKLKRKENTRSL